MPDHLPLAVSGPRTPQKAQPIPAKVRAAVALMVRGRDNDEACEPLGFIEAAREAGIRPDTLRRHLDRPAVRSLLLAERRRFRDVLCCANEAALARVRNTSPNGMSVVASVRALEGMSEEDNVRHGRAGQQATCGVVINIIDVKSSPVPVEPRVINATPEPLPEIDEPPAEPVFHSSEPPPLRRR